MTQLLARDAPKYWMNETSGVLAAAVDSYLNEPEKLTVGDLALLRAYLRQWVDSPAWDANPFPASGEARKTLAGLRRKVRTLYSRAEIDAWITEATEFGMDPL